MYSVFGKEGIEHIKLYNNIKTAKILLLLFINVDLVNKLLYFQCSTLNKNM